MVNFNNNSTNATPTISDNSETMAARRSTSRASSSTIPDHLNPVISNKSTAKVDSKRSPLPLALLGNVPKDRGLVLYCKTDDWGTHVGASPLISFGSDEFPKQTIQAYEQRSKIRAEDGRIYNFDEATILFHLLDNGNTLSYDDLKKLEKYGFFIKSFSRNSSHIIEKSNILEAVKKNQFKIQKYRKDLQDHSIEMDQTWFFQYALQSTIDQNMKVCESKIEKLLGKQKSQIDELKRGLTICRNIDDFAKFLGIEVPVAAAASENSTFSVGASPLFSEGIVSPSSRDERNVMVAALNRNVKDVRQSLIAQFPEFPITFTLKGVSEKFYSNNQYGLKLDDALTFDPDNNTIQLNDEKPLSLVKYKAIDGHLFMGYGEEIMCDQGLTDHLGPISFNSINDGNGWGLASQRAAILANETCLESLKSTFQSKNLDNITSLDIIEAHDTAIFMAHEALSKRSSLSGADQHEFCGTTCPQLLTVAGPNAFVTTIGDTKIFKINSDFTRAEELTYGNRGGMNARDCGGRIGEIEPDLRNLRHIHSPVEEGDILIMCSDGVHDNLDPITMGLSPQDVDAQLTEEVWNDTNPIHQEARNSYMQQRLLNILKGYRDDHEISGNLTSDQINEAINDWVECMTLKRTLGLLTSTEKEPLEKNVIPGKVDHAGLLVVQVEKNDAASSGASSSS